MHSSHIAVSPLVLILYCAAVILTTNAASCARRPADRNVTSEPKLRDLEGIAMFPYPPTDEQASRMSTLLKGIERGIAHRDVDRTLRRMIEQVPIQYIQQNLDEQARAADVPAPFQDAVALLRSRVNELRRLRGEAAVAFAQHAQVEKNMDVLCVCLFALRSDAAQRAAADALGFLSDPAAVRCLATRLYNAGGLWTGGYEAEISRKQLRYSLASGIGKITGIDTTEYLTSNAVRTDLSDEERITDDQVEASELLERCAAWIQRSGDTKEN